MSEEDQDKKESKFAFFFFISLILAGGFLITLGMVNYLNSGSSHGILSIVMGSWGSFMGIGGLLLFILERRKARKNQIE